MRPKVFLDTNVLLDVLLPDRPFTAASLRILDMAKKQVLELAVTTQSLIDLYYIALRLRVKRDEIDRLVNWLCSHVNVETIDVFDLSEAVKAGTPDPEDEAQYIHSISTGCDFFLTGDKAMLQRPSSFDIRILSPQQLLDMGQVLPAD